jgi:hypothetical protein
MGRRTLTTALLIATLSVAIAVPAGAAGFRLGAQIIGSNSSLTGDLPDEGEWESRTSVGAGLIFEMTLPHEISISLQPAYAPRGGREVFKQHEWVIGSIAYDLEYFSVPFIVRVETGPAGARGFVTAGLDFSFLIQATATPDSGQVSPGPVTPVILPEGDITDGFDSTAIAALFGAGVMVPVKQHFFTFELRYVQGLDDIINRGSSTETGMASPSVKFRDLHLLAAFLFTLGGGQ